MVPTPIPHTKSMEETLLISSLSLLLLICTFRYLVLSRKNKNKRLPPSPFALPIIGHLHLLQEPLHRTFLKLSHKLGPVFSLRFGSRLVVIVSSPSAVEQCFTSNNDIVLANRPRLLMGRYIGYNYSILLLAPYGQHWRSLRRLSSAEIFSPTRLSASQGIRRHEVNLLLKKLSEVSLHGELAKIELSSKFSELTFNAVMRMVAGKRYYGDDVSDENEARLFREIMREILESSQPSSYPGDFLPFWVDFNGFKKRVLSLSRGTDEFFQRLIDDCRGGKVDQESDNTMLSHLLRLQESDNDYYSDEMIKGLMLMMLFAGTDTSAVALEWAMANLLNHPEILKKAKNELDTVTGQDRLVEEVDLPKLKYLQCIINETLRLHPPVPLLIPHLSSSDCAVLGYDVPKDTILMVNAWAIHRDPNYWDEPDCFRPERFEGEQIDACNKLLPFGLGRRACPGAGLGQKIVGLALGSLIQCFEWKRIGEEMVDMREGRGLTMPKAQPLVAMCRTRHVINNLILN